jgi:hypothetical protein
MLHLTNWLMTSQSLIMTSRVLVAEVSKLISLVGERGYRAPPRNHFQIDVSRSKTMRRTR